MNGVCCIYSMNEEKDLREAMRKDIREEWRIQREIESRERKQREAEVERLLLQSLERRHQKLLDSSVGGSECIYETRLFNQNIFQQVHQVQSHRVPQTSLKSAYLLTSLFDEDLEEEEINPQEGR